MVNRRLRGAMLDAGVTPAHLAELAEVDTKTVQRWLTQDRIPYPITRHRVARALSHEETYLWPQLLIDGLGDEGCCDAVAGLWPTRTAISSGTWHSLFDHVKRQLDILIYAGAFLVDTLDLADVLRYKARRGVAVRVLVGDPDCAAVRARAEELGLAWLPARCRTTAEYFAEEVGAVARVRSHGTTLYTSQFRFDDILLVNTHAHGVWASQSPVLRLNCVESPMFHFYCEAFERVWASTERAITAPDQSDGCGRQAGTVCSDHGGAATVDGRFDDARQRSSKVEAARPGIQEEPEDAWPDG